MNYGLELNNILDKCNLSEEERNAFSNFIDGKVYQDKQIYPDCEKKLPEAAKDNPLLDAARKKIYLCGKWDNLIKLINPLVWSQKLKEPIK